MKKLLGAILVGMMLLSGGVLAATVNINAADATTLANNIKGVGEKKAQAIVQYRKDHGPFRSVDELANVPGIGSKTVEANRANLTVGKAANSDSSASAKAGSAPEAKESR